MATIKVKNFITRKRKDGTFRYYWSPKSALGKAGWKFQRLSDDKNEAISQAQKINTKVDEWRAGKLETPTTNLPGTIDDLIAEYKNSRLWKKLGTKTKKDYSSYLKIISQWAGDKQAARINSKMVNTLYESMCEATPTKAAYLMRVLRLLFSYAELQSIIPKNTNPATKIKITVKSQKRDLWKPEDINLLVKTADSMGLYSVATAVLINEWMGQRAGDIVSLPMNKDHNGVFKIIQNKTGAEVSIPTGIIGKLDIRIKDQIKRNNSREICSTTLLPQEDGKPYTDDCFSKHFIKIRKSIVKTLTDSGHDEYAAHFAQLTFQTTRHTAVTRLAEAGCELPEIASITGHTLASCVRIIEKYLSKTEKLAENAFKKRQQMENDSE